MSGDLVVISWDGRSEPHAIIDFDQEPRFRLLTFDYSGGAGAAGRPRIRHLLSRRTECKGQIYDEVAKFVRASSETYTYVGLIDDDVMMKVSDINHLLHVARVLDLDSFAPSLSEDSHYSHGHTIRMPNRLAHRVAWVEVMMPFYRMPLFLAGADHYGRSISSHGIDCYLIPMMQKLLNMENVAIVDAVMAAHLRPITSQQRRYSNGLTAVQERENMRRWCIRHIAEGHSRLIGTDWFKTTFGV